MYMGLFAWIVLGLLAGILAKVILPGRQGGGFIMTTLLGIAGGLIGGFVASLLGMGGVRVFDLRSLVIATLGAVALVFLFGRKR